MSKMVVIGLIGTALVFTGIFAVPSPSGVAVGEGSMKTLPIDIQAITESAQNLPEQQFPAL